jgi:hypothetical protein
MSGWGCPHEVNGECRRIEGKECDPGMKGCVLSGCYTFSSEEKNTPSRRRILTEKIALPKTGRR